MFKKVQAFQCSICNQLFPSKSILLSHTSSEHSEVKNDENQSENIPAKAKEKKEDSENIRKYQCDLCEMRFKRNSHLAIHVKSFHALKKHVETVHENNDESNSFLCNICESSFQ